MEELLRGNYEPTQRKLLTLFGFLHPERDFEQSLNEMAFKICFHTLMFCDRSYDGSQVFGSEIPVKIGSKRINYADYGIKCGSKGALFEFKYVPHTKCIPRPPPASRSTPIPKPKPLLKPAAAVSVSTSINFIHKPRELKKSVTFKPTDPIAVSDLPKPPKPPKPTTHQTSYTTRQLQAMTESELGEKEIIPFTYTSSIPVKSYVEEVHKTQTQFYWEHLRDSWFSGCSTVYLYTVLLLGGNTYWKVEKLDRVRNFEV